MMVQLDLDNVYLKITNLDKDPEMKLWNELSFAVQVYGQQEVHYRHLYNRKTKKTYAGLFNYVKEFFDKEEIDYELNDHRKKCESNADFNLVKYIDEENQIELKLRPYQQKIVDNCREREVVQACTGAGKAMPLDTEILTPEGFVKLRDIHVGSVIYDENGNKTTVIAEHPQQNLKQEYKITFDDGSYAICCNEHLWKYQYRTSFGTNVWHEDTLQKMIENGVIQGRSYKMAIPVCKPIQFKKKDLLIHPYVMGALLGDGGFTSETVTFTNVEDDVINNVNGYIEQFGQFVYRKDKKHIQLHFRGNGTYRNPFKQYLRETFKHCNSHAKFIPDEYKMSSVEDRIALLQGLFDTDGNITIPRGHIRYETVSEQLAKDVQWVLRSLGVRCKITKCVRDKCTTYKLNVCGRTEKFVSSKKHLEKFSQCSKPKKSHLYNLMKVVSIEPLKNMTEMKCLTVDSPTHTYICNDFIVTHNTLMMAAIIAKFNVKPVCIFADKIGLCTQLKQEMERFLGVEVGLVGDGIEEYRDITVFSVQSAQEEHIKEARMILFDECFPYKAKVMLADGTRREIGRIVSDLSKGKDVDVMSYNVETREFEPKKVINCGKTKKEHRKMMKINIRLKDGSLKTIVCTDNHKIWVESLQQYIPAKDLICGQKVISTEKKYKCEECGNIFDNLNSYASHMNAKHGNLNKKQKHICKICGKEMFCSTPTYKSHVKHHDGEWKKRKGENVSKAKKEFYSDEERSKFARKYMSEFMKNNNPMDRQDVIEKMVRSRKEYFDKMTDEEYSAFVRNFINASPTSFKKITHPEQVIIDLKIPNLVYNGSVEDSKTFRFKEDNSLKNSATPDFIYYCADGSLKFVECFGEYWHQAGDDALLEQAYHNNGYKALVLWEEEPLEIQIDKLEKFLEVTIR